MCKKIKMRPLWCKEECWNCGKEGLSTRTEERPASEPYYCEECETYKQVEEEADETIRALKAELEAANSEMNRFKEMYEAERTSWHSLYKMYEQAEAKLEAARAQQPDRPRWLWWESMRDSAVSGAIRLDLKEHRGWIMTSFDEGWSAALAIIDSEEE